jgi:hypothetical protein
MFLFQNPDLVVVREKLPMEKKRLAKKDEDVESLFVQAKKRREGRRKSKTLEFKEGEDKKVIDRWPIDKVVACLSLRGNE